MIAREADSQPIARRAADREESAELVERATNIRLQRLGERDFDRFCGRGRGVLQANLQRRRAGRPNGHVAAVKRPANDWRGDDPIVAKPKGRGFVGFDSERLELGEFAAGDGDFARPLLRRLAAGAPNDSQPGLALGAGRGVRAAEKQRENSGSEHRQSAWHGRTFTLRTALLRRAAAMHQSRTSMSDHRASHPSASTACRAARRDDRGRVPARPVGDRIRRGTEAPA